MAGLCGKEVKKLTDENIILHRYSQSFAICFIIILGLLQNNWIRSCRPRIWKQVLDSHKQNGCCFCKLFSIVQEIDIIFYSLGGYCTYGRKCFRDARTMRYSGFLPESRSQESARLHKYQSDRYFISVLTSVIYLVLI